MALDRGNGRTVYGDAFHANGLRFQYPKDDILVNTLSSSIVLPEVKFNYTIWPIIFINNDVITSNYNRKRINNAIL